MNDHSLPRNAIENSRYDIVKFTDGGFELEVNVSPSEETVWLTKQEMALLFDRDRSVISRHIKNIINENECSEKSNVHFLHIPNSDKPVEIYSLDIIISVGYRIKSQRGVIFRRWANTVLKQYLLRGYAIDSSRVLVSQENYLNLVSIVNRIDINQEKLASRVEALENKYPDIDCKVIFNGQLWDAASCIESLLAKAENSIILVDNYIDRQTLDLLSRRKTGVNIIIITNERGCNLTKKEITSFNSQCGELKLRYSDIFHDRFIILDKRELYYCGASLKDAGRKVFAIGKINDSFYLRETLSRLGSSCSE